MGQGKGPSKHSPCTMCVVNVGPKHSLGTGELQLQVLHQLPRDAGETPRGSLQQLCDCHVVRDCHMDGIFLRIKTHTFIFKILEPFSGSQEYTNENHIENFTL